MSPDDRPLSRADLKLLPVLLAIRGFLLVPDAEPVGELGLPLGEGCLVRVVGTVSLGQLGFDGRLLGNGIVPVGFEAVPVGFEAVPVGFEASDLLRVIDCGGRRWRR